MAYSESGFIRALVDAEIRRHVAAAADAAPILSASACTSAILAVYPNLDPQEVADAIIVGAAAAKVPVALDVRQGGSGRPIAAKVLPAAE